MNKKIPVEIYMYLFIFITITSVYYPLPEPNEPSENKVGGGWFSFHNGTRYDAIDFKINNIVDYGGVFSISMFIKFEGYNGSLRIIYNNETFPPVTADNELERNGSYHIDTPYLIPVRLAGEYPEDIYECNITLATVNDKGFPKLQSIRYHYNQSGWYIYAHGDWDDLLFRFFRNDDVFVYEFLLSWGYISLSVSIFIVLIYCVLVLEKFKHISSELMFIGRALYFVSNSFFIVYYLTVPIDFVVSRIPTHTGYHIEVLATIVALLIILQSVIYALRQSMKNTKED